MKAAAKPIQVKIVVHFLNSICKLQMENEKWKETVDYVVEFTRLAKEFSLRFSLNYSLSKQKTNYCLVLCIES